MNPKHLANTNFLRQPTKRKYNYPMQNFPSTQTMLNNEMMATGNVHGQSKTSTKKK